MKSRHILIADNEPTAATFLKQTLERSHWNCQISVAHSREELLDVLNGSPVDLLVADLRTPGVSGLELIRRVRASSPQTRTILITTYGNDEAQAGNHHRGAYRIITEPLTILDFTWAMQEALRDVAVSQPGVVVLSDESFEATMRQLEYLRRDIGAQCIFLADMSGQQLVETGSTVELDVTALLPLLARGFAAIGALARQVGEGEAAIAGHAAFTGRAVHLNFHASTRYEIYSTAVGDNLFLAMVYDLKVQASRIGTVWLYTRRTIERLLSILSTTGATITTQSPDTGFGSSLTAELDTLLMEEPTLRHSPGEEGEPLPIYPAQAEDDRTEETATRQFPMADASDLTTSSPPIGRAMEGAHSNRDDPEQELLDLEAAIARGLISAHLDLEYAEPLENQEKAPPPHQA